MIPGEWYEQFTMERTMELGDWIAQMAGGAARAGTCRLGTLACAWRASAS